MHCQANMTVRLKQNSVNILPLNVTLCPLDNFACFVLPSADFVFKINFFDKFFQNTIRVSNSLDPDQARHFVGRSGSKLFAKVISRRE